MRSSRAIERRCRDDVAFRVITANQVPDHATIARFRARHEDAISDLFGAVLRLCVGAGLVKVGIVAVDGTKIAAAEREADAKLIPRDRGERLRECRRRLRLRQDDELERRVIAEHAAWLAAGIASDGSRRMGGARNIKAYPMTELADRKLDVTDPDSRNLKTTHGWVQGYNAQVVVGEGPHQLTPRYLPGAVPPVQPAAP